MKKYANKRKIIQNIGSLQRFAKTQRLYMASKSIILTLIGLSINDQKIKFFESNETCKRAVPTIPFGTSVTRFAEISSLRQI